MKGATLGFVSLGSFTVHIRHLTNSTPQAASEQVKCKNLFFKLSHLGNMPKMKNIFNIYVHCAMTESRNIISDIYPQF